MSRYLDWRILWVALYLALGATGFVAALLYTTTGLDFAGQDLIGMATSALVGLFAALLCAWLLSALIDTTYDYELLVVSAILCAAFGIMAALIDEELPSGFVISWVIGWVIGSLAALSLSRSGRVLRRVPEEQEGTINMLTSVLAMFTFAGSYVLHLGIFALLVFTPTFVDSGMGNSLALRGITITLGIIFLVLSPALVGFALQSALPREADAGVLRALMFPGVLISLIALREDGAGTAFAVLFSCSLSALIVGLMMMPGLRVARERSTWKARSRAQEAIPSVRVVSK